MNREQRFRFLEPAWFEELESTNTYLRAESAAGGRPSGTVVAARTQTRGRGRMGNAWYSPPGGDVTFSFLWAGIKPIAELGALSMAVALGVGDWLATLGVECAFKWPNDVMTENGKICGIIAESSFAGDVASVVVGTGVNAVRSPERLAVIGQPTASIEDELGFPPDDPTALLPALLRRMEPRIDAWERDGFAALRGDVTKRLWGVGKRAQVRDGNRTIKGRIVGLDDAGGLVLEENGGKFRIVSGVVGLEPEAI